MTIFVYDMPLEHEAGFFDYLRDIGIDNEIEVDGVNPPEVIGVEHYAPELVLGAETEVADQLDEWGASYRVHQDAKYEYDAAVVLGAPGLGRFDATCTQNGRVLVDASAVDAAVADSLIDPDGPPLTERLAKLTGAAWEQRFAEVTAARQPPPAGPPSAGPSAGPRRRHRVTRSPFRPPRRRPSHLRPSPPHRRRRAGSGCRSPWPAASSAPVTPAPTAPPAKPPSGCRRANARQPAAPSTTRRSGGPVRHWGRWTARR